MFADYLVDRLLAEHDPAIFYDPIKDTFEELGGPGVALGVVEEWEYS